MNTILIAGMPASGKSTIATQLSRVFGYPILEKDAIKEELFDTIGFENYTQKRQLDVAATAILLRVADAMMAAGSSLILVNNFRTDMQKAVQSLLDRNGCNCVTLFFKGDPDVFFQRYVERDLAHVRHLGHVVQDHYPPHSEDDVNYSMTRQEFAEKFEKLGMDRFCINGPRIDIDATYPENIDVQHLIMEIQTALMENDLKSRCVKS